MHITEIGFAYIKAMKEKHKNDPVGFHKAVFGGGREYPEPNLPNLFYKKKDKKKDET